MLGPGSFMERRTSMKGKYFIIPILIVAFVTAIAAPPAHAELVTLTVILAAAFASAVVVKEVATSEPDTETTSKPDDSDSNKQARADYSKLESARP
jgi:hypothetical protein